ncbi:uncharacterized protein LOC131147821 [Malania oleifera]|uniref:uncharacterized protein LOC131147821 n=1 Tax=Malania oleifera TaxID=397392 RepID=UPI0025AE44D6|nr:uncharacterized protein LOC131147821 [Malania oleifera]
MAVSFEGFSIREYASMMRRVDVEKSWPFSGGDSHHDHDLNPELMEPFLPPITVPKFRWWAYELELVKSNQVAVENPKIQAGNEERPQVELAENKTSFDSKPLEPDSVSPEGGLGPDGEKLEMVCPVCRVFVAATVNAVNAHMDSCLVHASRVERRQMKTAARAKPRAPKKRSIVEIFAVAPQIEMAGNDDEPEDEDDADDDGSCAGLEDHGFDYSSKVGSVTNVASNSKETFEKRRSRLKADSTAAIICKIKRDKLQKLENKSKNGEREGSTRDRKENNMIMQQNSRHFARKLSGSICNKKLADILDAVSLPKTKPSVNAQKKHLSRTSKLSAKHQKPVFPVRGILKNHIKVSSGQKPSSICKRQCPNRTNLCGAQQGERHVRFSGKDDILGPRVKQFSSIDCPKGVYNIFSDAISTSSIKDTKTVSNNELSGIEVNGSDEDISATTENETEIRSIVEEKQLPVNDHVDTAHFLKPHISLQEKVDHYPNESISPSQVIPLGDNLHIFGNETATHNCSYTKCNPTGSHNPSYTGIPRVPSFPKVGYNPDAVTRIAGNVCRTSNGSGTFIKCFGDSTSNVAPVSSMTNMKALPQLSSSCFATSPNANESLPLLSQLNAETYNVHALQQQPFCYPYRKELTGSLCSFPEWNQRAVMFGERCMGGDFFGLPINSQGELIQLNSSGKDGFNELKKPGTLTVSSSSLPLLNHGLLKDAGDCSNVTEKHCAERAFPKDQFGFLPLQYYMKENPNLNVPSRLRISDLQSTGGKNSHWLHSCSRNHKSSYPLDPEQDMSNISCSECRQYDQVQNKRENAMIHLQEHSNQIFELATQPTMRLMGKDVTIGGGNKGLHGFEDGKVWTDKEIITEHNPNSIVLDNSSVKIHFQQDRVLHPALGKPNENVAYLSDIQSNQASKSILQMKAPESRLSQPYVKWQTSGVSTNDHCTFSGNINSSSHPFAHPPAPHALFNRPPNIQQTLISTPESFKVGSCVPVSVSNPFNICQHVQLNSAEFCRKSLPAANTKSAFEFPFSHPECREHILPSSFQSSFKNLPPWLLHATQQKETAMTSHPYFHEAGKFHSYSVPRTNLVNIPTVHHSSAVSYPYNSMTSHTSLQSSLGPASLAHPPLIPARPGSTPTAAISMSHKNRTKAKDKMKSIPFYVYPDCSKKNKKRRAAKVDDSTKPIKIPDLKMRELSCAVTVLQAAGNISDEVQCNTGAFEFDLNRDKAGNVECIPNKTQQEALRSSFGIDSFKLDGVTRPGPIKLSAGAKHILKPSQNMDNSRPTHSTIPFAAMTDSTGVPESQKKSAKIYKF